MPSRGRLPSGSTSRDATRRGTWVRIDYVGSFGAAGGRSCVRVPDAVHGRSGGYPVDRAATPTPTLQICRRGPSAASTQNRATAQVQQSQQVLV